jgi:hypothetical protein
MRRSSRRKREPVPYLRQVPDDPSADRAESSRGGSSSSDPEKTTLGWWARWRKAFATRGRLMVMLVAILLMAVVVPSGFVMWKSLRPGATTKGEPVIQDSIDTGERPAVIVSDSTRTGLMPPLIDRKLPALVRADSPTSALKSAAPRPAGAPKFTLGRVHIGRYFHWGPDSGLIRIVAKTRLPAGVRLLQGAAPLALSAGTDSIAPGPHDLFPPLEIISSEIVFGEFAEGTRDWASQLVVVVRNRRMLSRLRDAALLAPDKDVGSLRLEFYTQPDSGEVGRWQLSVPIRY